MTVFAGILQSACLYPFVPPCIRLSMYPSVFEILVSVKVLAGILSHILDSSSISAFQSFTKSFPIILLLDSGFRSLQML